MDGVDVSAQARSGAAAPRQRDYLRAPLFRARATEPRGRRRRRGCGAAGPTPRARSVPVPAHLTPAPEEAAGPAAQPVKRPARAAGAKPPVTATPDGPPP